MANPEHVRWLLEGVTAWNARRTYQSFVPDLREQDVASMLRAAQMVETDGRPNLREVNLSQTLLSGCNFSDTYLNQANLSGSDLSGARFENSELILANLAQSQLRDSDLTGANLAGASLGQANLTNCKLTGTRLVRPWQALTLIW